MADIEPHTAPPLIDFPCEFPIKVMGEMQESFTETITLMGNSHGKSIKGGAVCGSISAIIFIE